MRRLYSPRGARRGLWLAGAAIALWMGWAVGQLREAPSAPAQSSIRKTDVPAGVSCCLRRLNT